MHRKFSQQLGIDGLAIEPLLQHVEALHPPFAHDEKLAIDGSWQSQRCKQVGKACRNILAGARVHARDPFPVPVESRDGLHPDAVPFPFAAEILGSSAFRSPSSRACASIAGRNGAGSLLAGLSARPSSQANNST
jgi:hypothetical protein